MAPTNNSIPWSVSVPVGQIPATGLHRVIEADAQQRAALAALAGLQQLVSARATFDVMPLGGDRFHVTGEVAGLVVQACVVTLEPVENAVNEPIDTMFVPASDIAKMAKAVSSDDDAEAPDPPEPIVGGAIDLGGLAAEFLILGIDPYPRKPGVAFDVPQPPRDPEDHPFAALKGWNGDGIGKTKAKPPKKS